MQKFDYDIVIVGASIAGSTLAMFLAREGIDIALIEMKPRENIGNKVCGDGISASYFERFKISKPSGPELACNINSAEVIAPDRKHILEVAGRGFTINRLHLNQRFIKYAETKGVHLLDNTVALYPIVESNSVAGVVVKDNKTNEIKKIRAKVTVDASGCGAVIRNKVPETLLLEKSIDIFDIAACYREIVESDEDYPWSDDRIYIYLSHKFAPGGYAWIFPKGKNIANIGLGIQPLSNAPNPKDLLQKFKQFWNIKVTRVIHAGGGIVPVRRPLSQLVADGLILVGDAASQANPLHGGGMGYAMTAAFYATETIANIIDANRILAKEELWSYGVKYMRNEGAKTAALEILRLLLQGFPDAYLNFIIKHKFVSGEDLLAIESASPKSREAWKKVLWKKILRSILAGKISMLRRLKIAKDLYYAIKKHYKEYPENPKKLKEWHNKTLMIISEAREKLWRDPLQHTFYAKK